MSKDLHSIVMQAHAVAAAQEIYKTDPERGKKLLDEAMTGKRPSTGNPFRDGNLTEQMILINRDVEEARRLAKEAGKAVNF